MKIDPSITQKARDLMEKRAKENGAPAWELVEIAAAAAKKLASHHGIDAELAVTTSYLCHIVFSDERGSDTMSNHADLSANEAEKFLVEWGIGEEVVGRISHAVRSHHTTTADPDLLVEIVKQADTYKFLTGKGLFVFMVNLNERGMSLQEAIDYSVYKVRQKHAYVSLPKVRDDLADELVLIQKVLGMSL